jgi:hypothetical protein
MSQDLNNPNNNNSRNLKYEKENIELRRGKVLELDARGYSQHDISKVLNVSIGLVNSDLKIIREQARENIRLYINERLPEEYNKCLLGLNSILKESWTLSYKTDDTREKIQALSLAKQCYDAKLDLLTNVDVVEDVIKFIDKGKPKPASNNGQTVEPLTQQEADLSSESKDPDSTNEELEQEEEDPEEDANRE